MTARASSLPTSPSKYRLSPGVSWVLIAMLAGAACSLLAISRYGGPAIAGLVAVPIFVVIARRPLVAVVVLFAAVSSVFAYGHLPRVPLPGHPPINLGDVCLAAAVGGTLWRRPWRSWPAEGRLYFVALSGFLLLAAVATIKTSLLGYIGLRDAVGQYLDWLYLGVALTVVLELADGLWRPFLDLTVALAGIIACISIAAATSHVVAHVVSSLAPSDSVITLQTGSAPTPTIRVRVIGLYFAYSMCIPTLVMVLLVKDRWRLLRAAALLLIVIAIGVSLNRNMYIGLIVALLLTGLLADAKLRARVAGTAAIVVTSFALLVLTSALPGVTSAVGQRAATAFSPATLQTGSLQTRLYELRNALPAVARHPWFGVGPNQFYGAFTRTRAGQPIRLYYVEDFYIYIATDYGIPAAIAFMAIPLVCLFLGVARLRRATDALDRSILAGAIGTLVALLLSLVVGTYLQTPETTVAFAASSGLLLAAAVRTSRSPSALYGRTHA